MLHRFALATFVGLLMGCAGLPAEQAAGTPARRIAAESLVSVQANGVSLGAAVALEGPACDGVALVTNAHVLRQAGPSVELRRGDGGAVVPARVLAISPRMDLAVLCAPAGFVVPARVAGSLPERGAPVWAVGPQGLGRAVAQGHVARPGARMQGFGSGFTAHMGALMGFSGGPVVDRSGRLVGLTTALAAPGTAPVMAALTGMDVEGFWDGARREVFILAAPVIEAELRRIAPGARLAMATAGPRSIRASGHHPL